MYSWKKFKVENIRYGSKSNYWQSSLYYYENMGDTYTRLGKLGQSKFMEHFVGYENLDRIKPLSNDRPLEGYKFVETDIYYEVPNYIMRFKFVDSAGSNYYTLSSTFEEANGVRYKFEIINNNIQIFLWIGDSLDLGPYQNKSFTLSLSNSGGDLYNDYRATSDYKSTYPDCGVVGDYIYIREKAFNNPPIFDSYINLSKSKLNGYSDSVNISWRGAVDTDGNLEGYRLYVHKGSNTELIYTGSRTSYTYRVSGVTSPYDLKFSVEAFDSEGEKSDRIQSPTVSVFVPSAPRISGNDSDLGTKNNPFDISYIVEDDDDDDSISVTIKVDDNVVKTESAVSTGFRKTYTVDTKPLSFARHTVTIIAKDKYGGTDTRIYTFTKSNKAPTISGYDTNLGEKRSAFSVKYTIHDDDNDSVTVVEKLNGSIRRTLSNVQKDTEISLNISESDIKSLKVGDKNTIEIVASDSRGATAFRRYYFTRNNLAPTISGTDKDMGVIKDKFEYVFSISDVEKDTIYYSTYLDNKLLSKQVEAVDGKKYATVIEGMDMIKLEPGKHTFKIVAVDAQGSKSERIITFSRDVQTLIMMLKEPFATDVQSKKVLVAPGWDVAKGAECRVEVCNNGFDTNPTWEDATAMTELNKAYVFQNNRKTAEKWGVNIRLMIERKNAKTNSYITGIGGAFE